MGKTIPETTPKRVRASLPENPARTSITGNKTATAELTRELLARTEVIGRDALNSGFKVFLGCKTLLPCIKKQRAEAVKEKR